MLLKNKVEDPMSWQALQVTDIATARYALKLANDQYFAVIHMRQEMEKELARSAQEVNAQTLKLLQLFLTEKVYTDHYGNYERRPISYIPSPLPSPPTLPQWVHNGIAHMKAQLVIERERAEAELADQSEELDEMREYLEGLVKEWFIAEVQANPEWLGGYKKVVLGGCTLTYENGAVTFAYTELDYGD